MEKALATGCRIQTDFAKVIFKRKSALKNVLLSLIKEIKARYGIILKCARCNNSGEIENFERACKHDGMRIQFDYMVSGTPQQKGHKSFNNNSFNEFTYSSSSSVHTSMKGHFIITLYGLHIDIIIWKW